MSSKGQPLHRHLGLTDGANDETKARHAFVYGDFKRVHRTALIACVYRASEWRHKTVELAARTKPPTSAIRPIGPLLMIAAATQA